MKSVALEMSAVSPDDCALHRLVTNLRVSLACAAEAPMELSQAERVVREAHALRAALLRGSTFRK